MRPLARPSAAARTARAVRAARTLTTSAIRPAPSPPAEKKPWEEKSASYLARPLPSLRELSATPLTSTPSKGVMDNLNPSITVEPGEYFDEHITMLGGRPRPPLSTFYMRDPYYQEMMIRSGNLLDQVQRTLEVRGILRARELPPPPAEKYRLNSHWVGVEDASARLAGAQPGSEDKVQGVVHMRNFQYSSFLARLKEIARYLPYVEAGGVLSGEPPPFGKEAHESIIGQEAATEEEVVLSKKLVALLDRYAAPTSAMGQARKDRFSIEVNAPTDPDIQVVRNQPDPGNVVQARPPEQRFAKMWTMDVSGRIHSSGARKTAHASVWIVPSRLRDTPGENGMTVAEHSTPASEEEARLLLDSHKGAADTGNDSFTPLPSDHMIRPIHQGLGQILVNGVQLGRYFNGYRHTTYVQRALSVLGLSGAFNIYALVKGGGTTGQAGAVGHGIAKALVGAAQVGWITTKPPVDRNGQPLELTPDQQAKAQAELAAKVLAVLRKDGILRRDPRMLERKKTGKPGARASHTWVKR